MNESNQKTIPAQVSCKESLAHFCKEGEVFYVEHEYISGINRDCTVCVDESVDSLDRQSQAACENKIQNHPIITTASILLLLAIGSVVLFFRKKQK